MAFIRFSECFREPKYLIRLFALVLCMCIAAYQLSGCIMKMYHPPTTTHSSFRLNKTLKYPTLTICRNPGYKIELFGKYGLVELSDPTATSFWKEFNFRNHTLEEFFNETTYEKEDIVPLVGFDGKMDALEIKQITKLTYGKCFKFSPKAPSTSWQKLSGYSFYLKTMEDRRINVTPYRKPSVGIAQNELFRRRSTYGFHVFIHEFNEDISDDGDQSNSFMEYVYVESEQQLDYYLSVAEYKTLHGGDSGCRNDPGYSKSQCEQTCLARVVTEKVGCSTPWLRNDRFPACSSYRHTGDLIKTYNAYSKPENPNCNCPRSCNITIYMPHVAQQNDLDYGDQCALSVYYVSNLITLTEEVAVYDWLLFISDLGGSLGFLLGLSVLGIVSMIENIGKLCYSLKTSKRETPTCKEDGTIAQNVPIDPKTEKACLAVTYFNNGGT